MSARKAREIELRPATADAECYRVRLNATTIVLLKDLRTFPQWKSRYPTAEIMEPPMQFAIKPRE